MTGPRPGLPDPPILAISDRRQAALPLEEVARQLFAAGIRWFGLRDRDLADTERAALGEALMDAARRTGAHIVVHGSIDLARRLGCGAQVAANAVATARSILGPSALVGVSAHGQADLESAAGAGVDYATLSPVFPTASKPGYGPELGTAGFRTITAGCGLPVLALAGVTPERVADCRRAGAAGIAVMGPLMRAADPGDAARAYISAWRAAG